MKVKKIVYINQYFKTPSEAGSTRSYWVSRELIDNGFEVVMVCHTNRLRGKKQDKFIDCSSVDGIRVISISNSYSNEMGTIKRIISFLRFMLGSTYVLLKERNVDIVFASSTPLTVAFPALIRKILKKTPFIFEVRDLWPEAPIQLGFIKNKLLISFLKFFEKKTYENAVHINTLSPGMQEGVIRYVPYEKTSMVPNMAKIDKFWPRPVNPAINSRFGFSPSSFKVVYFGTMGKANGIDFIANAIRRLEDDGHKGFEFIFMGEGAMRPLIESLAQQLKNNRIVVVNREPMSVLSEIVNNCELSLCTFSDIPILKTNSPNKLFDTFSAGKPSIVNSDGWTRTLVEEYNCGFYVNPNDPLELVEKLVLLKADDSLRVIMGENSRRLAEEKFDKSILCRELVEIIKSKV